ncbi:MAG: hypothetical protein HZA32_14515 [Opitutae bacterium]|nr:hypothetical protein [Opitutae bacterium]
MKIHHILLSLGFIAVVAFAAEPTPAPPKVSKEDAAKLEEEKKTWPKTVDEAVTRILSTMPEKDRKIVRDTAEDDLIQFHHGWGTGIRNSFGLWRGNKALMEDCKSDHPDDASMVIIFAVWKRLQSEKK